jgi:uncharacterized protein YodC (DUF2158 family)
MNQEKPTTVGQIVQLKSGGPAMTIREVVGKDAILIWFNDGGNPMTAQTSLSSLVLVDAERACKSWPSRL